MSWFEGDYPSKAEMRRELRLYLCSAHKTKKHLGPAQAQLRSAWIKSRARPYTDVWSGLSKLLNGGITEAALKSAFRRRLLASQGGRCCYCRRWLVNHACAKPIEHVLPRAHYPQFSFEFWNLAVACFDCNAAKHSDLWAAFPKVRRRYPNAQDFSDCFHPRFHRYDDHVQYLRVETNLSAVVLFSGITPQGKHLCRSLLHRVAAKEVLIENNSALASALDKIRGFEAKAEGLGLVEFEEFRRALDRSLSRLIQ